MRINIKVSICIFTTLLLFLSGCKACKKKDLEPQTSISTETIILQGEEVEIPVEEPKKRRSKIRHIEIGTSRRKASPEEFKTDVGETQQVAKEEKNVALPPNTVEESALTARLRDKLSDAYGDPKDVPDVKIYISEMGYDEFAKYYESLGYHVQTVAVPASQIVEPVLEQRPELAGKIDMSKYENITIRQVMVTEAGISAADKYIDPDTFEIIEKTFVTKMNDK